MCRRLVVVSSAVFLAVVLSEGWESVTASQRSASGPGPVEQRAKAITPENPIPRRTYSVPADYPTEAEAAGMRGMVNVRVALDEAGQVAESRVIGISIIGPQGSMSISNSSGINLESIDRRQSRLAPGLSPESFRTAVQSMTDAAVRAVRQWQYDPPADGPVAFSIPVPIGPDRALAREAQAGDAAAPSPPAVPVAAGTAAEMAEGAVRVGGNIKAPVKLRHVNPIYPPDAHANRVQGVVILEARIEPDGRVSQARVLRSIPLLDDAALVAVKQWEFTPTLLNGEAVPVIMTVTVNFVMN